MISFHFCISGHIQIEPKILGFYFYFFIFDNFSSLDMPFNVVA